MVRHTLQWTTVIHKGDNREEDPVFYTEAVHQADKETIFSNGMVILGDIP